MNYREDIPITLARAAHGGTSHTPEDRADRERLEYEEMLRNTRQRMEDVAGKHGTGDLVDEEFGRFREGYRRRTIAYLSSRTRFVSAFICGPSGYPARRMQKRHLTIERRLEELMSFRERAMTAIMKTLNPGLRPIMTGDADAAERLAKKIRKAKSLQERMKAANAAIRKNAKAGHDAQVFALAALGFGPALSAEMLKPDCLRRIGFADYELRNNGAKIRQMEQRLGAIERLQATEATEVETETGVRVERVPAENRVRLHFPGRPAPEIIQELKRSGFRWAPSLGCWQGYMTQADKADRIANMRDSAGG